jgi:predicted dehydrogenase
MNRVKVAVVGVGALGQHHARILSTMENVELVGVVDSREQQGRSVAAKHSTQWFATAEEVRPLVDGVVIAVPTVLHYDVARPFLEAGIAVMIEKPLADGLEAARALQGLATFRGAFCRWAMSNALIRRLSFCSSEFSSRYTSAVSE